MILDDQKFHYGLKVISETEIATISCFHIKIWNMNSGICLRTLGDNIDHSIWSIIHLSKDQIASSDENGDIRIWNINNGECLRTFNENTNKCYLKKLTRNLIVSFTFNENTIKIWDTDTANCLKVLQIENQGFYDSDLF